MIPYVDQSEDEYSIHQLSESDLRLIVNCMIDVYESSTDPLVYERLITLMPILDEPLQPKTAVPILITYKPLTDEERIQKTTGAQAPKESGRKAIS